MGVKQRQELRLLQLYEDEMSLRLSTQLEITRFQARVLLVIAESDNDTRLETLAFKIDSTSQAFSRAGSALSSKGYAASERWRGKKSLRITALGDSLVEQHCDDFLDWKNRRDD